MFFSIKTDSVLYLGYHGNYRVNSVQSFHSWSKLAFSVKITVVLRVEVYHVGLHPLAILGPALVDVLSSLVGSHEADGFDGGMVTDEVHSCTKHTNGYCKFSLVSSVRHPEGSSQEHKGLAYRYKSTCLVNDFILWKFMIYTLPRGIGLCLNHSWTLFITHRLLR